MIQILTQNYINKVKEASKKISDIVGSTLGPGGRNVLISDSNRTFLTKDGVTVARNIKSEDLIERSIFKLIKESAERTNTTCGDGTSSTTILCDSFIEEIFGIFSSKNIHYDKVYKDIEKCLEFIYNDLESQTKQIESDEQIGQIAYLSSNGDKEIADLVKTTLVEIGVDGQLSIKESKTGLSYTENTDGYSFNAGFASQEFINNKEYKFSANDCIIFMYQGKLVQSKETENLMGILASDGRPIVIVAEEFDQALLSVLMFNKAKGSINIVCIEAPYIGHKKTESLKDLSMIVGGKPLHPINNPISNFKASEHLGFSKNVIVGKQKSLFIGNAGDPTLLINYIDYLKECLRGTDEEQEQSIYTYRINQLSSSTITIFLGANTPAELQEKKHRLEDALEAATIAIRGGIVPACCAALLRSISKMIDNHEKLELNYKLSAFKVQDILSASFERLVQNMNYSPVDIKNQILNSEPHMTYDLRLNKLVDAYETGCIEPLYVNLQSIKNSYSLAKVLTNSTSALLEG